MKYQNENIGKKRFKMKRIRGNKHIVLYIFLIWVLFQTCQGKNNESYTENKIKNNNVEVSVSKNIKNESTVKSNEEKNVKKDEEILTETRGMLFLVWDYYGKFDEEYEKKNKILPQAGEEAGPTSGFNAYLVFVSEDSKKYLGRVLTVWPGKLDGSISGKQMYEKILEISRKTFKNIGEMQTKEYGYISQPAKVVLKPVRMFGSCCGRNYAYAEIVKSEAIDSTTVKISDIGLNMKMTENDISEVLTFEHGDELYHIYSKEGYTNVRKGPSKDYGVIEKIKNETYATVMQDFGEWKYVNYFHTDDPDLEFQVYSKHGFVHKSQLKEFY